MGRSLRDQAGRLSAGASGGEQGSPAVPAPAHPPSLGGPSSPPGPSTSAQTSFTHPAVLPFPSHPSPGGSSAFPICELLSFGRELLPSVLWTVKQVFINKLR